MALSEHHATVRIPDGVPAPPRGDIVRIAPNHVCSAVNLADDLVVTKNGVIDHWVVAARGANT
ncbi:UNVERIFIED_ORG: D-serine deaminase-like pyridoxal phosphate-dependent protein [Arthrobacter sp. UYCu721]